LAGPVHRTEDYMKHRSDEQLVAQIATKGAQAESARRFALGELIRRYERPLYSYLVRFTCNATMAEDIFQECFLKLSRSAWRFDTTKPLRPWLFTIAANLARDELRRKRWQVEVSLDRSSPGGESAFGGLMPAGGRGPAEEASREEEAQMVRSAVAELDEPFRRVVELHFFEGRTCSETASVMRIPLGTVKSRLHTALVRLAAALEGTAETHAAAG